ncbi:MAG: DUF1501 domain-containing protein [Micavibrio sp.]|nr:DUF1501 domain-containing protein [Micavibrio sp.]
MDDIILSRRKLLMGAGCIAATTMFSGIRIAFADAPVDQRFVFIILHGAMDGLNAIPPYGDKAYQDARNGIALPASAYTPLDNFFGAHKSFAGFTDMFRNGEAAAIQAVSTPYRERSHFDAQNVLESGGTQPHGLNDGWLNRALALYGPRTNALGLAVGQTIPLTLQGDIPVGTWAPSAQGLPDDALMISLNRLYQHDPLLHTALAQAVDVHDIADEAMSGSDVMLKKNGGGMRLQNRDAMSKTVTAVGKILSDPNGPRIATIELGGWDTHAQQGTEAGNLANNFAALDAGFSALKASLGEHWKKTVVLAATEFGRTVAQNGTGGTDHGTASCAFLLGGAINGGRVYSRWPGLDKTKLYQNRDLLPTTDLRQVAKAILSDHLGLPAADVDARIFPGSDAARAITGMIRPT